MTATAARGKAPRDLVSPQDFADEMDVPVATVYQWATRGLGPDRIRVGRHIRYRRAEIEKWLDGRTITGGAA